MPNPQNKGLVFHAHNILWLGLSALAIGLDRWTKHIASTDLVYAQPVHVMPFLNWTLLHNYGAAFSFLSDAGGWQRYLFMGLAGLVSLIFVFWFYVCVHQCPPYRSRVAANPMPPMRL